MPVTFPRILLTAAVHKIIYINTITHNIIITQITYYFYNNNMDQPPLKTMKVLALISGGKDSIFNIKKCIDNGHEIVALGNLYNLSNLN